MVFARLASELDSEDIFLWRNDPMTRDSFFNSSKISWEEHIDWFKQKLISPSSKIIILEHDKNKIGVVRYDKEDSFYLVSINTNPAHRGKGLSSEMLIYSENLIDKGIEPVNLKANILKENLISKRTFIKAGYEFLREEDTFLCYTKSLQG